MLLRALSLEDLNPPPPQPESETNLGYQLGFEEGRAAAEAEASLAQARTIDAINQSLADYAFTFANARAALLQSLSPLFEHLAQQLLGDVTDALFLARITETCRQLIETESTQALQLRLSPERLEWLRTHPLFVCPPSVILLADEKVPPDKALFRIGQDRHAIDLSPLTSLITEALLSPTLAMKDALSYGQPDPALHAGTR